MSEYLVRIQKWITCFIVIIAVFTAGILVGKRIEKEQHRETEVVDNPIIETLTETEVPAESEENTSSGVSENTIVSGNDIVSGNNTVSGDGVVSGNQADGKPIWNDNYQDTSEKMKLEQRAAVRSSYEETLAINQQDKQVIANSQIDFSEMKIACLGDSITEGAIGNTPYPTFLKEILGAKEVINLGKGGSTVSSFEGVSTMIDRVYEIPEDTDLVIVIGGTNDNFKQPHWQFGFMDWETKGEGTFCGDLQLLMRKFKWNYPNVKVLFVAPPSNSKIDELKLLDPNLQDQVKYIDAINYIGAEEKTQVIDLYNANFLNSHDADIMSHFMIDKVHANTEGNRLLAERLASEIIKRYQ